MAPAPSVRSCEAMLAARVYWQVEAVTLQMFEQQSKSDVQKAPVGPQQSQVCPGTGPDSPHWELVPSDLRHDTGLHCGWGCVLHGSHGAGVGGWHAVSQYKPVGHAWPVEHGMFVQLVVPGS